MMMMLLMVIMIIVIIMVTVRMIRMVTMAINLVIEAGADADVDDMTHDADDHYSDVDDHHGDHPGKRPHPLRILTKCDRPPVVHAVRMARSRF